MEASPIAPARRVVSEVFAAAAGPLQIHGASMTDIVSPTTSAAHERAAMLATAERLGADAQRTEQLLNRVDAEFGGADTIADGDAPAGWPPWPTRQDAIAWTLAALCNARPTDCLAQLGEATDLRHCITVLAVASDLASGRAPVVRRSQLHHHLRGMAKFLEEHRTEFRGLRIVARQGDLQVIVPPAYESFAWAWDRVSGRRLWKRTSHFAVRRLGDGGWVYDIPPLDTEDAILEGRVGPWGLQMIGRPASYRRIPWRHIGRAFDTPAGREAPESSPWAESLSNGEQRVREWTYENEALFKFRVDLLFRLASLVGSGEPAETIWPATLRLLEVALLKEQAEDRIREFEMEILCEQPTGPAFLEEIAFAMGPLAGVLELTGHLEFEVEHRVFERIAALTAGSPLGDLDPFAALEDDQKSALALATRTFLEAEADLEDFWERFRVRLVGAFPELRVAPMPPPIFPRARYVDEFHRRLEESARRTIAELEALSTAQAPRYVFAKVEGGWLVQFGTESGRVRDTLGMQFIWHLLQSSPKEWKPGDLRMAACPGRTEPTTHKPQRGRDARDRSAGLSDPLRGGGGGTPPRIAKLLERAQAIRNCLDDELDPPESSEADALNDELDAINAEIKRHAADVKARMKADAAAPKAVRLESGARRADDESIRAGIAVAIKNMRAHACLNQAADHFERALHKGRKLSYQPPPGVAWSFDPPSPA